MWKIRNIKTSKKEFYYYDIFMIPEYRVILESQTYKKHLELSYKAGFRRLKIYSSSRSINLFVNVWCV